GSVPSWAKSLFKANPVSYILEDSTVDPVGRRMLTRTRNMDHRRFLLIEETQEIVPHPSKEGVTRVVTTARVSSGLGWGLTAKLEKFGVGRFAENLARSRQGLLHVLEKV
ncbi:PRELI-like family-domain-containing protein, partial [Catenaria anguillulae PL171]